MKEIHSVHHPLVKHLVRLREKREYRVACQSALLSGIKLIKELSSDYRFKTVLIRRDFLPAFSMQADQTCILDAPAMKKVTGLINPEPLAVEIDLPKEQDLSGKNYLLILDGISDPGNLGTLLRTALALGWQGVLFTPGSTDPFNEKALRAAKGATFKIPLKQASLKEINTFIASSTHTILAADAEGLPMEQIALTGPVALVLGNEAYGLSPYVKSHARRVAIPIEKEMESLNVACAGAILMHFLKR